MTKIRPMNQFCCGCTLTFGVKLILILNLMHNVFYIVVATCNVLLQIPFLNGIGSGVNLATQTFNAGFCLAGLPFIFAAWWGVIHRLEPHMRLYLTYVLFTFAMDLTYVLAYVLQDPCESLPRVLEQHGEA